MPTTYSQPPPAPHFLAARASGALQSSRLASLGPTPFSTPPMPRKVLFTDSPQSEAQKTKFAAFGHSPGPSPFRETTPQSHQSWQPATHPPANPSQTSKDYFPFASTAHTAHSLLKAQYQAPQSEPTLFQEPRAAAKPASLPSPLAPQAASQRKQTVRPVMTSSRKRAAVGSLSPTSRPLEP